MLVTLMIKVLKNKENDIEEITLEKFEEWLKEIIIGEGSIEKYVKKDVEGTSKPGKTETRNRYTIYTEKYSYYITLVERLYKPNYLGCTMSCRKPRAGENWTRGNDLPDGSISRKTWESIKNAIIKNELIQLEPKRKPQPDIIEDLPQSDLV